MQRAEGMDRIAALTRDVERLNIMLTAIREDRDSLKMSLAATRAMLDRSVSTLEHAANVVDGKRKPIVEVSTAKHADYFDFQFIDGGDEEV